MTQLEIQNYLKYALLVLAAFAIGCMTALVPQLMDPSMPVLNWRTVIGTGISAAIAGYGGSFLARGGSTGIAAQVDALKAQDVQKRDMIVLSRDDAVATIAGNGAASVAFTPEQVDQIAARLLELRAEHEAPADHIIGLIDHDERTQAPTDPLPPNPRYPREITERNQV